MPVFSFEISAIPLLKKGWVALIVAGVLWLPPQPAPAAVPDSAFKPGIAADSAQASKSDSLGSHGEHDLFYSNPVYNRFDTTTLILRAGDPQVRKDSAAIALRRPDAAKLEAFLNDGTFHYDRQPPPTATFWQLVRYWLWQTFFDLSQNQYWSPFWRIVSYLIFGAAAVFVILKLTQTDLKGLFYGGKGGSLDFQTIVEDIHGLDLDALIDEAIQNKQYRRAVRYCYLRALKLLSNQNLIVWRADKTNRDYISELRQSDLRPALADLTNQFEHVWYGDFPIDEPRFLRVRAQFDAFTKTLASDHLSPR
ncbi:MAG: DUF4129 domain-containing protein [Rhizobacter sp.]|nr:DUF4129 domain-containing protein [Chlorobiales bacterium]